MRSSADSAVMTDLENGSRAPRWASMSIAMAWLVAGSAAVFVVLVGLRMDWIAWGGVGIMSAIALAAGLFAFPVARRHYVSFGTAVYAATLALFGVAVAAWVVTISGLILAALVHRGETLYSLRDVATRVLGIIAAGACYFAIGGKMPLTGLGLGDVARFAAMFVMFGAVTTVLRMLTGDHRNEPIGEYIQWLRTRGVVAELAMLPLSMLMVASYIPGEPATFPLLATVLIVVGAAGKGLWETGQGLATRVEQLNLLNDLGQAASSTLHVDELMSLTHRLLRERLEVDAVCLTLLDELSESKENCTCMADGEKTQASQLRLERSLVRRVVDAGGVIQIDDLAQEIDRYGKGVEEDGDGAQESVPMRSWLGLPLVIGEQQIGVLSLQSRRAGSLGGEQLRFFETLASRLARIIENIRLQERLEESRTVVEEWNSRLEEEVQSRTAKLRATEAELAALNRDLERRVEKRTGDLKDMQANVVRSGRLAAVGELAAGVAHELNNPLGGILGFAQFNLEKLSDAGPEGLRQDEVSGFIGHLSQIEREAKRCSGIVSNLVAFSEPSGSVRSTVDINEIISATVEMMTEQFRMRGLAIEVDLADSLPGVHGSAAELK
ncbi:GAF domain-containing protein, partial [bacterium]|nr:GAF domain-containing protein [bacterium]